MSYLFAFSYCSWDSQGKNTEVVCQSLLQWTTFCQNSPPWPICLGWPYTAWFNFTELDKAVVCMIRLIIFLWLWFQSVCPLMPSLRAYHLTGVSLTLDVGYLFMVAPAKRSRCPLPWTWDISSRPLLLSLDVGISSWPLAWLYIKVFLNWIEFCYQTILISVSSLLLDNYNGPCSWWQYMSIMIL